MIASVMSCSEGVHASPPFEMLLNLTDVSLMDQVYKIVVQWSNGATTVIYRRYSMFFDFLVSERYLELPS